MPLLSPEKIRSPFWQYNGHLQTIAPNVFRKVEGVQYRRERLSTWDDDFLDLDWSQQGSRSLVIISHGLAGSSEVTYMKGLVKAVNDAGLDALAWNYRGCSGEPNRKLFSFHGGKSDDLQWVIQHASSTGKYDGIYLIGVSMGGNITLKLLGEWGEQVSFPVKAAVAISVPLDLYKTSLHLVKGWNRMYSNRYLRQYKEMLRAKEGLFPDAWDYRRVYQSENLHLFVENFTAPSFGFRDAREYLCTQSASHFIGDIRIPALLINAENDPFLTSGSFPVEVADRSDFFYFLQTNNGGHVGFDEVRRPRHTWMEHRALEFLLSQ